MFDELVEKNINDYIDKYCVKHEVDRETAKTHFMVKVVSQYYKDKDKGKLQEPDPVSCECELEDKSC